MRNRVQIKAARTAYDKISQAADAIVSCKQITDEKSCKDKQDPPYNCQFVKYPVAGECQYNPEKLDGSGDVDKILMHVYGDLTYHDPTKSKAAVIQVLTLLELNKLDHAEVATDRREQIVRNFNWKTFVQKYQDIKQTQGQKHEIADPSSALILIQMCFESMKARCENILSPEQRDTLNDLLKNPSTHFTAACEILRKFLGDHFPELKARLKKIEEELKSRAENRPLYRNAGAFATVLVSSIVIICAAIVIMSMPAAATAYPAWVAFGGYLSANVNAVAVGVPMISGLAGVLLPF